MIPAVATRLADQVAGLATVRTSADLASLATGRHRHQLPAAFVHPRGDRAAANALVNAVSQTVRREIGVLLVVAASGADRGAGAPDLIDELLAPIRTALIGFEPAGGEPLTLAGGDILKVGDGQALWLDRYATSFHLRST